MNPRFLPWLKLAWAWVTAVVLCISAIVVLVWQTSGPGGRQAQIKGQIEELREDITRMEQMMAQAEEERTQVSRTTRRLGEIQKDVFGRFEERLTAVMREIGSASRSVGMLPEGFTYSVKEVWSSDAVRFSTTFSVIGTFEQVRELLILLQGSSQFLIIESIGFAGEEDPRSNNLGIKLRVASFLTEVESERLETLIDMLAFEPAPVEVEGAVEDTIEPQDGSTVPADDEAPQTPEGEDSTELPQEESSDEPVAVAGEAS